MIYPTERFYTSLLGEPSHRTEDSVMYEVGDTRLFFSACDVDRSWAYEKEQIGLSHLAFGVRTIGELQAIRAQLVIDRYGEKEFIWLDDPDGMRVEFYLRELA